jgi:N-formylglutamate amidohydrolase
MPVLLSVPHAGRDYPDELLANLRVPLADIVRLEDRYADRLVQPAIASGFPAIVAHRARAWIDLNRAETDIDAAMFHGSLALPAQPGVKARGGLGLFPRRLQHCGELWRSPMREPDAAHRIAQLHRPYHKAIADVLAEMRDRFGFAVLIDVHSMPPLAAPDCNGSIVDQPPQIVIGDRFGRSAGSIYAELILDHSATKGWRAALNSPYSGAYILQTHGQPRRSIHALQLEIDRSLYLDGRLREPAAGLAHVAELITDIARDIVQNRLGGAFAEAAE